ncbi:DUF6493 family protein [Planotetraspora sp. A-T 1434]|uniref:DUF6493 family protein n=1 Tax=Planotetraspora sp. A-T 1434 TaxID=2979219 RepID=UPI0021C172B3|nr:DUF6493 family protein [Planotetraspora sp. A-T 1434]MCT9933487.1 DUF6493 family protein [Planotetraspora sp. A-T 1434]
MTAWDEIRDLIDAGDAGKLIERLVALDDGERKLVAGELRGRIPVLRDHAETMRQRRWAEESRRWDEEDYRGRRAWREPEHEPWEDWADLLRLAGAGTLSAVSAVASWVTRRDLITWRRFARNAEFGDPAQVVRLLDHRPAEWQAELAVRLAAKIRGPRDAGIPLALAMLRHTGAEPPQHDPLVVAWVSAGVGSEPDPLLPVLLPRIFEADGVGRALQHERVDPISPWLRTLRDSGDRESLLDGCVRRFLRGGTAQDLRFFVRLHELLEPSAAEVEPRRRDYLRLLPAAPGPVAELALRHLRRLDAHEPADVVEAVEGLLFRAEATLVRAGLTWFDQTVRQEPERAGELAPALVTAFHHESYDVQGRVAQLALKHAARFSPLGAEQIRDAIRALPPALGARLVKVFGGEPAVEEPAAPFTPPPLPEPSPAEAFPTVPASPVEMRALGTHTWRWQDGERWLAGFVRLAGQDRDGLRSALAETFGGNYPHLFDMRYWTDDNYWRAAMARELITPGADPGIRIEEPTPYGRRLSSFSSVLIEKDDTWDYEGDDVEWSGVEVVEVSDWHGQAPGEGAGSQSDEEDGEVIAFADLPAEFREQIFAQFEQAGMPKEHVAEAPRDRLPDPPRVSPPHLFLLRRCAEVMAALKDGTLPPVLLATPTSSTGALDPDVLVSRLEECEAAHAGPLAADLQQALLRLPRGAHPEAAARAARLTSEAGRTAARWLAGDGLRDPEAGVRCGYIEDANEHYFDERPPGRVDGIRLTPVLNAVPTGLDLIDELLTEPSKWAWEDHGGCMDWWSPTLPSHREVVAVNLLPHLLHQWNGPGVYPVHAARLAAADGPVGAATALVLAYLMAQKESGDAVSVFLTMAACGDLPAAEIGAQLGLLIRWTWLKQQHVVNALESAAHCGAHREVWQVLRTLVPAMLPAPGQSPRPGAAKLVKFAVTVAGWADARGEIPEVGVIAGRKNTSMFTQECRRLHGYLTRH